MAALVVVESVFCATLQWTNMLRSQLDDADIATGTRTANHTGTHTATEMLLVLVLVLLIILLLKCYWYSY